MKSLEDLKKLRDSARQMLHLREGGESTQLIITMGTCGIAAGARDTLAAIMAELSERNLREVVIKQTGCIGFCDKEPLVEVMVPGEERVTYAKVDAARARRIVEEHVMGGRVIAEWVLEK